MARSRLLHELVPPQKVPFLVDMILGSAGLRKSAKLAYRETALSPTTNANLADLVRDPGPRMCQSE
jgi:hypothetical protein